MRAEHGVNVLLIQPSSSFSLLLSSLELSDTQVYEPEIQSSCGIKSRQVCKLNTREFPVNNEIYYTTQ